MSNIAIKTNNLTVKYGKHRGIEDVNLEVKKGEIFGFLGLNGAGKTTTMRALLDFLRPASGTIEIWGMNIKDDAVKIREKIGYLPGELNMNSGEKVSGYLDMIESIRGTSTDKAYREELCKRLNLDTSKKIKQLSRGNKQKVGLVAALMSKPEILILDEPTGGLDPLMQETVMEFIREAASEGRTVLFSSHVLSEVEGVCDRVAIIREGKIVETNTVDTLTKQQFIRVKFKLNDTVPDSEIEKLKTPGIREIKVENHKTVTVDLEEGLNKFIKAMMPYGIKDMERVHVSLEEIFMEYYESEGESNE